MMIVIPSFVWPFLEKLYCWLGMTFLGFPLKCSLRMTLWGFRLKCPPDKLIWTSSWLKQYDSSDSRLKMIPDFSIQINSWLKRKHLILIRSWFNSETYPCLVPVHTWRRAVSTGIQSINAQRWGHTAGFVAALELCSLSLMLLSRYWTCGTYLHTHKAEHFGIRIRAALHLLSLHSETKYNTAAGSR